MAIGGIVWAICFCMGRLVSLVIWLIIPKLYILKLTVALPGGLLLRCYFQNVEVILTSKSGLMNSLGSSSFEGKI